MDLSGLFRNECLPVAEAEPHNKESVLKAGSADKGNRCYSDKQQDVRTVSQTADSQVHFVEIRCDSAIDYGSVHLYNFG